jgi:hypothetical protein
MRVRTDTRSVRSDFGPLPPELDPKTMHVAERSIERVIYVKTFTGAEARRLQDLIENQEFFDDARRSYQISYRTVDALPQP